MVSIITNSYRSLAYKVQKEYDDFFDENKSDSMLLSKKARVLAWIIFLIFFIENGTLGILPRQFYMIHRTVRASDLLMYGVIIYSLFNAKEMAVLYNSRASIIIKIMLLYITMHFIGSVIFYKYDLVETFFRLKFIWASFLVFPFLLLLKRNALHYFIRILFPFAIVANLLYILSSLTGIAFLPDISIEKQSLPGGLQVYRVFGGTFFGELFFLGFIYYWITRKIKFYQLFFIILFMIPHILAFGRSAWIYLSFTIFVMFVWNMLKKKNFKIILRQLVLVTVIASALIYTFMRFIPKSDYLTEALGARIEQGQDDYKYQTGTYGSRLENTRVLLEYWLNTNMLIGIGMHPFWVIRPVTVEENIYGAGFSDVRWIGILVAYGLIGFVIAAAFQLYYFTISFKLLKKTNDYDIYIFFILTLFSKFIFDSVINYSYMLFTTSHLGLSFNLSFYMAVLIYKYEKYSETLQPHNKFNNRKNARSKHFPANKLSSKLPLGKNSGY
jgi:hypothetical protein